MDYSEHINFRGPMGIKDRFRLMSDIFGGSTSDHHRTAVYVYDCHATIAYLESALAKSELTEDARAAAIKRVRGDLERHLATALEPRRMMATLN